MPPPDQPSPPRLQADGLGSTESARAADSLALAWNAVSTADRYDLRLVSSTGTVTDVNGLTAITRTVAGLKSDTEYRASVRARNNDGASAYSGAFATRTRPPTPAPPRLAGNHTPGQEPTRGPDFLDVEWVSVGSGLVYDLLVDDVTVAADQNPAGSRVGGLTPNARHSVRVRSRNPQSANASFWTSPLSVVTRPPTPDQLPPPRFDAVAPLVAVDWQLTGPGSAVADVRRIDSGTNAERLLITAGPLVGTVQVETLPYGLEIRLAARLVVPRNDVPGQRNESFWGPDRVIVTSLPAWLFARIQQPQRFAMRTLRGLI